MSVGHFDLSLSSFVCNLAVPVCDWENITFTKRGMAQSWEFCQWNLGVNLSGTIVLWHCWLEERKGIWPMKKWALVCWCGYLTGVTFATATSVISCCSEVQDRLTLHCHLT